MRYSLFTIRRLGVCCFPLTTWYYVKDVYVIHWSSWFIHFRDNGLYFLVTLTVLVISFQDLDFLTFNPLQFYIGISHPYIFKIASFISHNSSRTQPVPLKDWRTALSSVVPCTVTHYHHIKSDLWHLCYSFTPLTCLLYSFPSLTQNESTDCIFKKYFLAVDE